MSDECGHDSNEVAAETEWTPARGLLRALAWGILVAVLLAILLSIVAWYAPTLLVNWLLRAFIALLVTWVLFSVIHGAAGMVGWPCTWMAIGLALLVMLSNHLVFAWNGVPTTKGTLAGPLWLDPTVMLIQNLSTLIGVVGCAALRHSGGADWQTLRDLLMFNPRGF